MRLLDPGARRKLRLFACLVGVTCLTGCGVSTPAQTAFPASLGGDSVILKLDETPVKANTSVPVDALLNGHRKIQSMWITTTMQGMSMPSESYTLHQSAGKKYVGTAIFVMGGTWTVGLHVKEGKKLLTHDFIVTVTS